MSTLKKAQQPLQVSRALAAVALVAFLVLLAFPSSSEALQEDIQPQTEYCDYAYNELIADGPCFPNCSYNDFITGAACTRSCDYDEFIAWNSCDCDYTYDELIAGAWCPIALYSPGERERVDDDRSGDKQQVQSVAAAARPLFVDGTANDTTANGDGAAASPTRAASATLSGLAVTGADDRIPLGGLVLLGLGSFAVAVSRRRLPV